MRPSEVIDRLHPIGLDELNRRASLFTRLDRKYLLPVSELGLLLSALADRVQVLQIGPRREFAYQSSYFDSSELSCYLDSAHRRRHRFKVRVRSYLDSGLSFLEVKTRGPRGDTVKDRVAYHGTGGFDDDARQYAEAVLAGHGIRRRLTGFQPVLTTRYSRTTLFVPATASRVTVDTAIEWTLPGGPTVAAPETVFVETKSNSATHEVDRLLWSHRHRPCSVSKYGTGLAALRPDLPSHHWRPVLRRHFPSLKEETSS
ncbi:VTC domain-containing protein [Rhizocola hellebori]|uniref:VTC domain-containing protein n=1 Tax=Rhizocola hellebori TaxID=1392758 RepID=A0A8J3VJQ2_9ACTN|nr:polyphosphate polymerase domain-containing protein [Rhizocola hellebori]GIH08218.1 VTC domain-containing protein [Rhizocola hellebori]